ncbi:MAG: hypothetical protein U5J99_12880 [Parvularculaceae bacterium]|nr:hypothetical protein [Parvularculaceae bacterium]
MLKAFAATFAYLAEHWLMLLKAMWLPALIITALQLYAAPGLFNGVAELALLGPNPEPEKAAAAMSGLGGSFIWYIVAGFIFFPMLTVASLKHIVRGEEQGLPFYFAYGADETRVMAANFLFNLMIVVIALVGEIVVGVLAAVFTLLGPAAGGAIKSIVSLGLNAVTGWFQARVSPLFPAVIATRTLGFGYAWSATRRDWLGVMAFWILIGVVIIPAIVILLLPTILAVAADIGAVQRGDAAATAAMLQKLAAALSPSAPQFWMTAAAVFLMTLGVNAVVNTASAVIWRYLGTDRGDERP